MFNKKNFDYMFVREEKKIYCESHYTGYPISLVGKKSKLANIHYTLNKVDLGLLFQKILQIFCRKKLHKTEM